MSSWLGPDRGQLLAGKVDPCIELALRNMLPIN